MRSRRLSPLLLGLVLLLSSPPAVEAVAGAELVVYGTEINQGLPIYPLVAQKTTLARVYTGVGGPSGSAYTIDSAVLDVTYSGSINFTIQGTIPTPTFSNRTQRYTERDNVNFYIPGSRLPEGPYTFSARLYADGQLVQTVPFQRSYTFSRTNDVRLFIVAPDWTRYSRPYSEYVELFNYLWDLARVFPVRDGVGGPGSNNGIQVILRLGERVCDGNWGIPNCRPWDQYDVFPTTRFQWTLVQPGSGGQRRTRCEPVPTSNPTTNVPCQDPGGNYIPKWRYPERKIDTVTAQSLQSGFAYQHVSGTFLYFPGWPGNTADPTYDLDYDGVFEANEFANYVVEYDDPTTGQRSQDMTRLQPGYVVRDFADDDGSGRQNGSEAVSNFVGGQLRTFMHDRSTALRNAYAYANGVYMRDPVFYVWRGMDQTGTGGGTSYGDYMWAAAKPWSAFHQELGHQYGLVPSNAPNFDGQWNHSSNSTITDPRAFVLGAPPRAVVNSPSIMPAAINSPWQDSLFELPDYSCLFQRLRGASTCSYGGQPLAESVPFQDVTPTAVPGPSFEIIASFPTPDVVEVYHSQIVSDAVPTETAAESEYSLLFLAGAAVLREDRVPVHVDTTQHDHGTPTEIHAAGSLHAVRPLPDGTTAVEIRRGTTTLRRLDRPANPPSTQVNEIPGGHAEGMTTLTWDGSHQDAVPLTYNVLYSPDGGQVWHPLSVGHHMTSLEWDTTTFGGGPGALVRVEASDGFNVTSSITAVPFSVPAKAPSAIIVSPERGSAVSSPLTLRGTAFDLQDGILEDAAVEWSSDRDGALGAGNQRDVGLSPGRHIVTFRARNSLGLESTATVEVIVGSVAYFAEGTVRPGFVEYMTLQNPLGTPTTARLEFQAADDAGSSVTVPPLDVALPALSRVTRDIGEHLTASGITQPLNVSVKLTSAGRVVAERPMYFNTGLAGGADGGTVVSGAKVPSLHSNFAEGTVRPGFVEFLTIQNPGTDVGVATVRYQVNDDSGRAVPVDPLEVALPAGSRVTRNVNDDLAAAGVTAPVNVSLAVESTVPMVAERPLYFRSGLAGGVDGGTDVVGISNSTTQFRFAEGTVRPGFVEFLTVQNPGSVPGTATVTFQASDDGGGPIAVAPLTLGLPPQSRVTQNLNDYLSTLGVSTPVNISFSLDSTVPVVAERPLYFQTGLAGGVDGATDVVGATAEALSFRFAEGTVRDGFVEFLTIQTPGDVSGTATIAFQAADDPGNAVTIPAIEVTLPARSRVTRNINSWLADQGVAGPVNLSLEVVADVPILAERPIYFRSGLAGGVDGGTTALGVS